MQVVGLDQQAIAYPTDSDPSGPWVLKTFARAGQQLPVGMVEHYLEHAQRDGCEAAIIEDVFSGPNIKTHKNLAARVQHLIDSCRRVRLPWALVHPSTWRAYVFGLNGGENPKRAKDKKARALEIASALLGRGEPLTDDEADAVCIALYGRDNTVLGDLNYG